MKRKRIKFDTFKSLIMNKHNIKYQEIITALKNATKQSEIDNIVQNNPQFITFEECNNYIYYKRYKIINHEENNVNNRIV